MLPSRVRFVCMYMYLCFVLSNCVSCFVLNGRKTNKACTEGWHASIWLAELYFVICKEKYFLASNKPIMEKCQLWKILTIGSYQNKIVCIWSIIGELSQYLLIVTTVSWPGHHYGEWVVIYRESWRGWLFKFVFKWVLQCMRCKSIYFFHYQCLRIYFFFCYKISYYQANLGAVLPHWSV